MYITIYLHLCGKSDESEFFWMIQLDHLKMKYIFYIFNTHFAFDIEEKIRSIDIRDRKKWNMNL